MRKRKEKGSVTLFVVISCLVIIMMIFFFWTSIENKKQAQNKEIDQVIRNYKSNQQDMEKIYTKVENNS